ncbi:APC family permease [Rothia nasisuis]|uniref:APC family permease n=1 Tax=Rothia nasisuis TaxID=2109647 RepID=UPI001F3D038E|nr:APC family permease [Rothia nasisuis]
MSDRVSRPSPGKLSTTSLVLMIIAASAPLTVLAGGVTTNYAVSGLIGVPFTYLVLGIILLIFVGGYAIMSTKIQNSGAFYAYVTAGLGPRQGIASAILALISYNMMQIGLYGIFGFSVSTTLNSLTGVSLPWWLCALVGWAFVGLLGARSIDLSAKVLGTLVLLEFVVVIGVSVFSLFVAPEGISSTSLRPSEFFVPGIGVLLAFGFAAFMGFESGAIYSEETVNPHTTVARATYIAVTIISLFYMLSSWAWTMGVGPSVIIEQSGEYGPDLLFVWLGGFSTLIANTVNALFVTSLVAALLAFHNASARYFLALGRTQVIPRFFARSNQAQVPLGGSLAQSSLALIVIGIFAIAGSNSELGELFPVITLFTWFTNAAAFGLVFLLGITSVAMLVWFNKQSERYNLWVRAIAPFLSAVFFALIAVLVLWNFDLMIGAESFSPLVVIMPGIIIASGVGGLIWGHILGRRNSDIYRHFETNTF